MLMLSTLDLSQRRNGVWAFEPPFGIFQSRIVAKEEKIIWIQVALEIFFFILISTIYIRRRLPIDVFVPFRTCFYS